MNKHLEILIRWKKQKGDATLPYHKKDDILVQCGGTKNRNSQHVSTYSSDAEGEDSEDKEVAPDSEDEDPEEEERNDSEDEELEEEESNDLVFIPTKATRKTSMIRMMKTLPKHRHPH